MAIYIQVTNQQLSAESDFIKYEIAGTFTLLACLISMWHVWGHLRHFGNLSHPCPLLTFRLSKAISATASGCHLSYGSNLLDHQLALFGLPLERTDPFHHPRLLRGLHDLHFHGFPHRGESFASRASIDLSHPISTPSQLLDPW
jgi:hypothetical protein